MSRSPQGRIASSPRVDFPVYGLDPSWAGSRWLESFGDRIGDPVTWVSLGHRSLGGDSAVLVQTFYRPRLAPGDHESPICNAAGYACPVLINITLPGHQSDPRPGGFIRALAGLSEEQARRCEQWPLAGWRVDGADVHAHVWRFAGGWAAVSDPGGPVVLAAIGMGAGPDGLSLEVVRDAGAYHFDPGQPLGPDILSAGLRRDGGQENRYPRRTGFHPDQLLLMQSQDKPAPKTLP